MSGYKPRQPAKPARPAVDWVRWMMRDHVPYCGHPACKDRAFVPAAGWDLGGDPDGHVTFWCQDMGHWVGVEYEVRWVPKTEHDG